MAFYTNQEMGALHELASRPVHVIFKILPSHYTPMLSLHLDSRDPPLQDLRMSYLSCSITVKFMPGQLVTYKYQ